MQMGKYFEAATYSPGPYRIGAHYFHARGVRMSVCTTELRPEYFTFARASIINSFIDSRNQKMGMIASVQMPSI